MSNANKSAQPLTWIEKVLINSQGNTQDVIRKELGLTKREHFAAMAMQGILANKSGLELTNNEIIETSIYLSDELLSQLETTPKTNITK